MADRTIVLAQNKRHAVRGVTVVNPQEFSAYQEDDDDLTYIVDMSSYLDGATISSVTRTPTGVTVSNTSNTTTRLTQRLKGFGYVDINVTSSSGEVEQFRITIQPRGNSAFFLSSTGSVPQNTAQMWDVVADVTAANIDNGISWIRTQGYYTVGDGGGALYKRVYSVPSHGAYITSNTTSSYWELASGENISVKQCGASGNGTTDDTAAINVAFNYLRFLVDESTSTEFSYFVDLPPGEYKVTSTINATAIRNRKWGIRGPGQIVAAFTSSYPVLDFTHSFSGAIRDLCMVTAAGFTPGIGLLLSRDDSGAVASGHLIDMASIIGSFSIAPVYNYGCEDVLFIRSTFNNQSSSSSAYAGIFDGTNSLGAASPFRTIPANTAVSFNDVTLFATEFLRPSGGPPVFLRRTTGMSLENCYAATTSGSSIIVNSDGYGHVGLHLHIHCETAGLQHCVEFTGEATQTISGFAFVDYGPQASVAVFKSGSGVSSITLRDVEIRIDSFQVAPSSNLFSTASVFSIYGGRVYINDNTYNNITSLSAFNGILETNTLGRYVARTSFDVNGTKVVGARDTGWTAMTGTTNKATSYDTAAVTTAQLAGRVMAIQAALTTHGLLGS